LPQGKSAWKVRDGIGEERDKYYGGFQQVGEDYLFKSKDSAKLVNICFFFGLDCVLQGPKGKNRAYRQKTPGPEGRREKKAQKKPKRSGRPSMRGGTRRRRVKIMEKKYWSRVCYRRIFFAIILRGWGAIGTGGQIFLPFSKKKPKF
jgi:hypothetical protein